MFIVVKCTGKVKVSIPLKPPPPVRHKVALGPRGNANTDMRSSGGDLLFQSKSSAELAFDVEDLKINWGDLVLKERIGAGTFIWCHKKMLRKTLLVCHIIWWGRS